MTFSSQIYRDVRCVILFCNTNTVELTFDLREDICFVCLGIVDLKYSSLLAFLSFLISSSKELCVVFKV